MGLKLNKVLIAFWPSVVGSACYAQAAKSGGGIDLDFTPATIIPIFLFILLSLLCFFVFKLIRRNMIKNSQGFIAAVPTGLYIVLGLILLAGAFFAIMIGADVRTDRRASGGDNEIALMLMYGGYFFAVLGGVLMLTGLFKGIVSKTP